MNYNELMSIDEGRLDAEWAGQACRFMEFVEAEAEANRQVDALKEKQDTVEAGRALIIRKEYEDTSRKLTEASLSQLLVQDAEVHAVKEELRQAVYQQDMVNGARKAMEHRKAALENLVIIQGRNNRADPVVAGATKAQVTQVIGQKRMAAHAVIGPSKPQTTVPATPVKQPNADSHPIGGSAPVTEVDW
jgi:hypothetical protein